MNLWATVGTRPEAIKLAPVILALRRQGHAITVVATGQHPELTVEALRTFELAPDRALPQVQGELPERLGAIVASVGQALAEARPDALIVHGDTVSTLGAALAARYTRTPLAHVEAGLRTGDRDSPFPEEGNRRVVDALADRLFAPTALAAENLAREGIDAERVSVTGNPIVDAVRYVLRHQVDVDPDPRPLVLVTAHRRENLEALERICRAVARLAGSARIVWPVHPNPAVEDRVRSALARRGDVELPGPLPYPVFLGLLSRARLVLTDSGGVQEEAACLGVPTLVLRSSTERPEVLATGVVAVVGTREDDIVRHAERWLASPPTAAPGVAPLGDGHAGERIAGLLAEWLA